MIKNQLNVSEISTIETDLNKMFLKVQLNFNDYTLNDYKVKSSSAGSIAGIP